MTITEGIEFLVLDCKSRNLSPRTVEFYLQKLGRFAASFPGKEVEQITTTDLRRFMLTVPQRSGPRFAQCLKTLFRYLHAEELIAENPSARLKRPKVDEIDVTPLTPAQIQLLAKLARSTGTDTKRDEAIFATLISTGMRGGELIGIKEDDVTPLGITINGKGRHRRTVPIPAKLGLLLIKFTGSRMSATSGQFFRGPRGQQLDENGLHAIFVRLSKRSGLRVYPHLCRHSFASHFMNQSGASVLSLQAICGWKVLAMANRYAHIGKDALATSMNSYSPASLL